MLRALIYVVPVALAVYALIDLVRSTPTERPGLSRWVWVAIVVLLPVVGPIVWLVLRRRAAGATGARPAPGPRRPGTPGGPRRTGPLAPDDDPDFLWRLEQQQRRRRHTEGTSGAPGTSGTSDEHPGTGDTAESGESTGDQTPPDEGTGPAR